MEQRYQKSRTFFRFCMSILFEQMPKGVLSEEMRSSKLEYKRVIVRHLIMFSRTTTVITIRKITDSELPRYEQSYFVLNRYLSVFF